MVIVDNNVLRVLTFSADMELVNCIVTSTKVLQLFKNIKRLEKNYTTDIVLNFLTSKLKML